MTQGARTRRQLRQRPGIKRRAPGTPPLFATITATELRQKPAEIVGGWQQRLARWAGSLLRSWGSTLMRVRWGLRG